MGHFKRLFRRFIQLGVCVFSCVACTKSCKGIPELGSQALPVRFYLSGVPKSQVENFQKISACIEQKVGFLVRFESAVDDKSVADALRRGDAHFGYLGAFEYIDLLSGSSNLKARLMRYERNSPLTRSVILAKTSVFKKKLGEIGLNFSGTVLKSDQAISLVNNGRFVFVSPESDAGFFVPRHLLLERNVFPEEAIFAGTYPLVLQALQRELAFAGAVSEAWLSEQFPTGEILQVGSVRGDFLVLALSSPLPGKVVVGMSDLPSKTEEQVTKGLEECSNSEIAPIIGDIFGGDDFGPVNERLFGYVRELVEEKDTYLRTEVIRK